MEYKLAYPTWNHQEQNAIRDVTHSLRNTMGPKVREFEEAFAEKVGSAYAVMVNSGSSANLLAVGALRYMKTPLLKPGDEVIVPALSWSTTLAPIHQNGMKIVFIDIELDTLNVDILALENAVTDKTKALMVVNILGNPANLKALRTFCDHFGLCLIEDNCESMGASLDGKQAGTFGTCGTYSLFFSHHINTIEGGVIVTDNEEVYHILLAMRSHGWTRDIPVGDFKPYEFIVPGYNVRPPEMAGAIGLKQMEKLDEFIRLRRRNAYYFRGAFADTGTILQKETGNSSWFGFSMILKADNKEVIEVLGKHGIESRPILAGNFINQEMVKFMDHRASGELTNAETVDKYGIYVGNSHIDLRDKIDHLKETLNENGYI